MTKEYKIITSINSNNFDQELQNCIQELLSTPKNRIVSFAIFLDAEDYTEYIKRLDNINLLIEQNSLSDIPYCIISQTPLEKSIAIELVFSSESLSIERKKFQNINYCLLNHKNGKELILSGVNFIAGNREQEAVKVFDTVFSILERENFQPKHIVRQWNYIESILKNIEVEGKIYQNYQIFNEVRNTYYASYFKKYGYPAATGIGMQYGGLLINLIAFKPNAQSEIIPIDNPKQIASYNYHQKILVGNSLNKENKSAPNFERAKLISSNGSSSLYVSGTASIIGEKTYGINNIEIQTRTTLQNIETLYQQVEDREDIHIQPNNQPKYIRVYLKNGEDLHTVKHICQSHFNNTPMVFVKADVCRDNLLVEIETEY